MHEKLGLSIIILSSTLLLIGCHHDDAQNDEPSSVEGNVVHFGKNNVPPMIEAAAVGSTENTSVSLSGRIVWDEDRTVRLFSPFSGRVDSISVKLGDHVRKNQPLAVLESPDYGSAQTDYRKAIAAQHLANANLQRARDLFNHGVIAEKELQQTQSDAAAADADAERTARLMNQFSDDGNEIDQHMVLRSPLDGVVVERAINPGQELRNDQSGPPVFVITDPRHVWLELDAHEIDLPSLRPGKSFAFKTGIDTKNSFHATVFRIADFVDPTSRTIKLIARANNDSGQLKGEMFVTAQIPAEHQAQPEVPATAVYLLGNQHYAFVKDGDDFVRREVSVANEDHEHVVILAGLKPGEHVVNQGALFLQQILQTPHG